MAKKKRKKTSSRRPTGASARNGSRSAANSRGASRKSPPPRGVREGWSRQRTAARGARANRTQSSSREAQRRGCLLRLLILAILLLALLTLAYYAFGRQSGNSTESPSPSPKSTSQSALPRASVATSLARLGLSGTPGCSDRCGHSGGQPARQATSAAREAQPVLEVGVLTRPVTEPRRGQESQPVSDLLRA
jgi:hypothetical protein